MSSSRPGEPGRRTPVPRGAAAGGPGRSARPAPRRRPAAPARSGLTVRAAWLGLVLCVLVLSAAVPLRALLSQRGQIADLEEQQAAQRARVQALTERKALLEDPANVEKLARERLGYVRPGETAYVVLRPPAPEQAAAEKGAVTSGNPDAPWYSQLWDSVQAADVEPTPAPAPSPEPVR